MPKQPTRYADPRASLRKHLAANPELGRLLELLRGLLHLRFKSSNGIDKALLAVMHRAGELLARELSFEEVLAAIDVLASEAAARRGDEHRYYGSCYGLLSSALIGCESADGVPIK